MSYAWPHRARRIISERSRRSSIYLKRMVTGASGKPVLTLASAVIAAAVTALSVAVVLRITNPVPLMIVGPFEIPQPKEPGNFTGKTLSNMLVDDLQDIIQNGNHFRGLKPTSSSKQYPALPDCPEIPIQTSFGLEIKGISLDQLRNAWNFLRFRQQLIGGDLVRTADGGAMLVLRLTASGIARHWETKVAAPVDYSALRDAMTYLASELLSDMNPEITGRYFLGQHQFAGAQKVLRQWAQREPGRAEPFFYLALAFEGMTPPDRENAERMARKARDLDPNYHLAIGLIANCEGYRNDLKSAIADNLVAHHLAPRAPNYLTNLAIDYTVEGDDESDLNRRRADYQLAISYAKQTLRVDPDMVVAYYILGEGLESTGDKDGAVTAYREAMKRRPEYLIPLDHLESLLVSEGRFNEAIEAASVSSSLNPQSWVPLHLWGRALVAHGQFEDGIAKFKAVLDWNKSLSPSDEDRGLDMKAVRLELAKALLKEADLALQQGQTKKAADYYNLAVNESGGEAQLGGTFSAELQRVHGKILPQQAEK